MRRPVLGSGEHDLHRLEIDLSVRLSSAVRSSFWKQVALLRKVFSRRSGLTERIVAVCRHFDG